MKQTFLKFSFLTFLFAGTVASAQYNALEVRVNSGGSFKVAVPFEGLGSQDDLTEARFSSFSADLVGYKSLTNTVSARLRFGYRSIGLKLTSDRYDENGYNFHSEANGHNRSLTIAPGLTRNFAFEKLTLLASAEIPVTVIGKTKGEYTSKEKDNDGVYLDQKTTLEATGGFATGLNGIIGLRYALAGNLQVGLDLNMGVSYMTMNGKAETETQDFVADDASTFSQEYRTSLFSVTPLSGSLVVGMKF